MDKNKPNEAFLYIQFLGGSKHSVKIILSVVESVCKVTHLSLSKKILFVEYEMGGAFLIPAIILLPKVFQFP